MHSVEEACDVLLVDDSADALALLSLELGAVGLQVHTAASGELALAYLARHLPGAILLDVQMPGMDGFETCERIREQSEDVPVIFMTGLGETEHIVRGFAVGGNDYVTKPVSPPEVIARLQAHTRTARLVRATREAVNASSNAMLAVDEAAQLLWCNDAATQLLGTLEPGLNLLEGLPIAPQLAGLLGGQGEAPGAALRLANGSLQARRVSEAAQAITVFALTAAGTGTSKRAGAELTARESEVLLWVARGKTNRDIGEILGMSPRTVNKHLEHIFEKLGVETRTAAASAAARALGLP
ncbi:response regulator [Niveibacterium sp. 24ML]|uniref:response regulator n=1 Tax=Niveibacterium sp. 24ML TaxID=2985512 RepID=UPI002271B8C7|nr:response regulator [Niveibacterium sp. 24ML]MCX9156813.1 response regulator [Niveibacterium sp. 24ML]